MLNTLIYFIENGLGLTLENLAYLVIVCWGLIVPLIKFLYKYTIKPIKNKKGGEM